LTPKTTEREVIDGPAGALEVVINAPVTTLAGIALIAHPLPLEGGTLDNKVVYTLAKTFFALGCAAVRFNFRGVGASVGTFDEGNGETDDALAALAHGRQRFGNALPIFLAGFSFGSFVQTRVAHRMSAAGPSQGANYAPLGQRSGESRERGDHMSAERMVLIAPAVNRFPTERVPPDTIVVHGEQDDVVPLADVFAWARPQELPIIVFPGCGHFFHGRLPQLQRVITAQWQRRAIAAANA
jgi:uncharacterized protein